MADDITEEARKLAGAVLIAIGHAMGDAATARVGMEPANGSVVERVANVTSRFVLCDLATAVLQAGRELENPNAR